MDLAKLESDFKASMLPEFNNSKIEFIGGTIYFSIEIQNKKLSYHCHISQFESDTFISGTDPFFKRLKSELSKMFLGNIGLNMKEVNSNYINYLDDCRKRGEFDVKSILQFTLRM